MKEFTWNYFLQLPNGFVALCILVIYHSEYAVIFITNWSPPHISWQMTSLYSFKHNTKNMRTKKKKKEGEISCHLKIGLFTSEPCRQTTKKRSNMKEDLT